jgi:Fe-S-cluster containining protein
MTGQATLHLRVLGEVRKVIVDVPPTPAASGDILPAVRAISNATMHAAMEQSAAGGAPCSCRLGCNACCHQVVGLSAPEARRIAALVEAMPEPRRTAVRERFAQTIDIVRRERVLDLDPADNTPVLLIKPHSENPYVDMAKGYYRLRRPCPFLEDGACSIYDERPLVCREYVVSSPAEHCTAFNLPAIEMIQPPVRMSDALTEVTAVLEKKPPVQIPLFAALAWAAMADNAAPPAEMSGPELLMLLAKWIDRKSNLPLEDRP